MIKNYDPNKTLAKLREKGFLGYKCPICKNTAFSVQANYTTILLSESLDEIQLKSFVPAAIVICKHCGHIDLFSLFELGVIDKENEENE